MWGKLIRAHWPSLTFVGDRCSRKRRSEGTGARPVAIELSGEGDTQSGRGLAQAELTAGPTNDDLSWLSRQPAFITKDATQRRNIAKSHPPFALVE
jgi:hypothetical protein